MSSTETEVQNEEGAIKKELKDDFAWNTRTKKFYHAGVK